MRLTSVKGILKLPFEDVKFLSVTEDIMLQLKQFVLIYSL